MSPLYLRYRNSEADPWTVAPTLTTAYPALPAGAVPLESMQCGTEPQNETRFGYPTTDLWSDDHYILRADLSSIPQSLLGTLNSFLLNYKQATYHEAQHTLYGNGGFISSELSLLEVRNEGGRSLIGFRLAAAIADAI